MSGSPSEDPTYVPLGLRYDFAMPNYRRMRTPGATWFFTVNLLDRRGNDLLVRHIDVLRECVAAERKRRPLQINAWVVLPEHSHWLWTLPEGDADYSTRWRRIKTDFSRALPRVEHRSAIREGRNERAIWQRRFWEHQSRSPDEVQRNPGLDCGGDWIGRCFTHPRIAALRAFIQATNPNCATNPHTAGYILDVGRNRRRFA